MEMNRGSLNPLFARRPTTRSRRLHLLHRLPPLPPGPPPHGLFPLRSRASAVRPCRFARFILSLRPFALLPYFLSLSPSFFLCPFLSHQRSSSCPPRLACGQNPRAQLLPLFAHLITRIHKLRSTARVPATPPGYFYSRCNLRTWTRRIYRTPSRFYLFFARFCGNVIFRASACDVSIWKHRLRRLGFRANWSRRCTSLLHEANRRNCKVP